MLRQCRVVWMASIAVADQRGPAPADKGRWWGTQATPERSGGCRTGSCWRPPTTWHRGLQRQRGRAQLVRDSRERQPLTAFDPLRPRSRGFVVGVEARSLTAQLRWHAASRVGSTDASASRARHGDRCARPSWHDDAAQRAVRSQLLRPDAPRERFPRAAVQVERAWRRSRPSAECSQRRAATRDEASVRIGLGRERQAEGKRPSARALASRRPRLPQAKDRLQGCHPAATQRGGAAADDRRPRGGGRLRGVRRGGRHRVACHHP